MSAGRPTKYNEEVLKKAHDYAENYGAYGDKVPSVEGLSYVLGITRETMRVWRDDPEKQEFSDTLDRMLQNQARVSLNGGIDGTYNPTICKLLLANHGYSEKQQVDHTTSDGSMRPASITIEHVTTGNK